MPEQLCGSGCSGAIPERVSNDVQGLGGGLERFGGSGAVWGKSAKPLARTVEVVGGPSRCAGPGRVSGRFGGSLGGRLVWRCGKCEQLCFGGSGAGLVALKRSRGCGTVGVRAEGWEGVWKGLGDLRQSGGGSASLASARTLARTVELWGVRASRCVGLPVLERSRR